MILYFKIKQFFFFIRTNMNNIEWRLKRVENGYQMLHISDMYNFQPMP